MAEESIEELAAYDLDVEGMKVHIRIYNSEKEFSPIYEVTFPGIGKATKLLLDSFKSQLISLVHVDPARINEEEYIEEIKNKYIEASNVLINRFLPGTEEETKKLLISYILNMMLGLGDIQPLIRDYNLEEIAVNGSSDFVWVFHKIFMWCKTTIKLQSEDEIYNRSEQIGRAVGREINNLVPIMDAELTDGSRVNATLYPISQTGNTITIRKFAKNPWTMPAMISNKTLNSHVAGLIWECIENEISLLIAGGTASGKTSFLNAMSIFFPANRRIISIEETRELTLPSFYQWLPMLTRAPNPEGKGEVSLYDLMINALRQRPDIVLVGEIRTEKDAETLFEAIHTGHAVYGTVHADNAQDTVTRMTNPPIAIPKILLNALGGIVVQFRHRAKGIRRVLEFAEILRTGDPNVCFRWNMKSDMITQISELSRLEETLSLYTGLTTQEIEDNISKKAIILEWMANKEIFNVNDAGLVIANYYKNKDKVLEIAKSNINFSIDIFK
ncbi:MAG: ATPase, T2SS/T4P/T4SS family [Candidatus Micrarchaeaceae archaeon]